MNNQFEELEKSLDKEFDVFNEKIILIHEGYDFMKRDKIEKEEDDFTPLHN